MTHEKTGRAPIEMALLNYSDHNFEDLSFAILIIKEEHNTRVLFSFLDSRYKIGREHH